MANAEKGDVTVTIDGQVYTLALTLNALCELEERFGETWQDVAKLAQQGRLVPLRALLWASMRKHHPDLTIEQFGAINIAELEDVSKAFAALLERSQPDPKDLKELGGKSRPPQARVNGRAGTGASSTSTGAELA